MYMDDIMFVLLLISTAVISGLLLVSAYNNLNRDIEIIKKQEDFKMYKNCEELDNIYYCYEEVTK